MQIPPRILIALKVVMGAYIAAVFIFVLLFLLYLFASQEIGGGSFEDAEKHPEGIENPIQDDPGTL